MYVGTGGARTGIGVATSVASGAFACTEGAVDRPRLRNRRAAFGAGAGAAADGKGLERRFEGGPEPAADVDRERASPRWVLSPPVMADRGWKRGSGPMLCEMAASENVSRTLEWPEKTIVGCGDGPWFECCRLPTGITLVLFGQALDLVALACPALVLTAARAPAKETD
jgi:hypothetical protein